MSIELKLYSRHFLFKRLFWLALSVAYFAAIVPQDVAPSIPEISDKAHHVFAFMVLGILFRFAYKINYWYALVLLIGFGGLIEISQYYTPTRVAEMNDVLADTIGALIGLKLYKYFAKLI